MSVRALSTRLARLERAHPSRAWRGGSILTNGRFWDMLCGAAQDVTDAERSAACEKMLAILNRRTYIRNLLREVDEVLES